jgi:hypothetical protein
MTDSLLKITVTYSCNGCGANDRKLDVPARPEDMDLMVWMNQLAQLISNDHAKRSPGCRTRKMRDLKIPIDGADWVGGPPIH